MQPSSPPVVSVLLPVFNGQDTLAQAISSVRDQTLTNHELIVVLNGCTDASASIVQSFARTDARVRILELARAGLVPALNEGLRAAKAPLIARLDADDRMMPERLERQVRALTDSPGWAAVACGVRHQPEAGHLGEGMQRHVDWLNTLLTPEAIRASRFIDSPIAHPSVAFRKAVVQQLGSYRDGDFPEDYELWLRLFEAGMTVGKDPTVLVEWRDRAGRLTRTDPRYRQETHRGLRHRYLLSGPLAGGRRCRIWGAGPFGRRHARELASAGARIDDLIDIDPRKIGRRVAGGLLVSGLGELRGPDGRLVLLSVGSPGAREQMTEVLESRGYRLERDYLALQ